MINLNKQSYYQGEGPSHKLQKNRFYNNLKILYSLKQDPKFQYQKVL